LLTFCSFNRREDDFNTLYDYNNYLNEVEDITYDLINGSASKAEAAEKKLGAYAQSHRQEIARNALLAKEENASRKSREEASREQARLRREAELREDEMERQARLEGKRDIINQLAASDGDADAILKRALTKRTVPVKSSSLEDDMETMNGDTLDRGLKKRVAPGPEKPYDPFHDMQLENRYYVVQDRYPAPWLDGFSSDKKHVGGGYEMHEYFSKTLFEAFSGFGVFVQEEVADRSLATSAFDAVVAPGKGIGAKIKADITMDDVF
jgi:CDK-activating kinase assembly factor MAT1